MIILKEQEGVQTLKLAINGCSATSIVLVDEETSLETEINCEFYISAYYMEINVVLDVKENKYYTVKVKNDTEVVYTGLAFCTNQDIVDYSINNNVYTENTTNNEFIIYE
jgi:hypothetical protein